MSANKGAAVAGTHFLQRQFLFSPVPEVHAGGLNEWRFSEQAPQRGFFAVRQLFVFQLESPAKELGKLFHLIPRSLHDLSLIHI